MILYLQRLPNEEKYRKRFGIPIHNHCQKAFLSPKFSPIVKINFQVGGLSDIIVTQRGVGASVVISFGALEVLRWCCCCDSRSIYCIDWHNGVAELQVLVERSKSWSWAYLFFFRKKTAKVGKCGKNNRYLQDVICIWLYMYMILWCIYYTYINWYQSISSCIIYHDIHAYKFIAPFLGATWYRPGWCQLLRGCKHAGSLQNPHEHQHWSIHGLISNRSQPTTGRSRFNIFNQHRPEISLMFSHPNFLVVDAFWRFGTLDL